MTVSRQEMLSNSSNSESATEERVTDGLRILAQLIACAYQDSNRQAGREGDVADERK